MLNETSAVARGKSKFCRIPAVARLSSSIGTEAQNMIECYRTGKAYPNSDYSSGLPDEIRAMEIETWWTESGQPSLSV